MIERLICYFYRGHKFKKRLEFSNWVDSEHYECNDVNICEFCGKKIYEESDDKNN